MKHPEILKITAVGGVLLVWYDGLVTPGTVGTGALIKILIIAVLGGMRHPLGAFIGAVHRIAAPAKRARLSSGRALAVHSPLGAACTGCARVATAAALDFVAHFGLIDAPASAPREPQRRLELLRTCMIRTPEFRFTQPVKGYEVYAKDELIATDGDEEIRAPCDDCTIFMPARRAIVGREGVYLTRPLP